MAEWWQPYLDAWNAHDGAAVASYMADGAVYEDVALNETHTGRKDIADFVDRMAPELSTDYRFEPVSFQQSGDAYAGEWRMVGTHNGTAGPFPATGKQFEIRGVSIGRLEGGKIRENRDYWDMANFLGQIGMMPAAEGSASS
jgi:steroid delta-isomerase-like uncharacterized protein